MINIPNHAASATPPENAPSGALALLDQPSVDQLSGAFDLTTDSITDQPSDNQKTLLIPGLSEMVRGEHINPEEADRLADLTANRIIVLVLRGPAGISYATLLSLFLAFFLEGMLAAIFILIMLWQSAHHNGRQGGALMVAGDRATAVGGIMQPTSSTSMTHKTVTANWKSQPIPRPPSLHPNRISPPMVSASSLLNPQRNSRSQDHLIGLSSAGPMWTAIFPAVKLPKMSHPTTTPHIQPAATPPVRSRGPKPSLAYNTRSRNGIDPNEGFGNPVSLIKGMHFSNKDGFNGAGVGRGRGLSAFNDPRAHVLRHPSPIIPLKYQLNPPKHSPVLRVTVLPNGRAGTIRVIHSSGVRAVDQACVDALRVWKFFPAIKNGKKVVSEFTIKFPIHGY